MEPTRSGFRTEGMETMTQTKAYLTNIQCHKLQNIVGQGCVSPYQVLVAQSDYIGLTGQVFEPGLSDAANQDFPASADRSGGSWMSRVLRTLGLNKD
jgi:hypothetical protein